jgi:hypothetical protein
MTDTDPPNQEGTDEAAETPTYKSPLEQILEKMPFFGSIFGESGKSGGGGGNGRFEFSLEEMRELHRQFKDEVAELDNMLYDGSLASNMLTPLAPDEASQNHYKAAREHFAKMQEAMQQQRTFAVGFARAIENAINVKTQNEEDASSAFRSQEGRL